MIDNIKHNESTPSLSQKEYDELFPIDKNSKSIREKALERAWHVRDFEIELYWKRATYFWAFIATSLAGYFALVTSDNFVNKKINPEIEFILICIGFIFSSSWLAVNLGSKYWQENWEGHIDLLEDNFIGPLYRTVRKTKSNFSVSKVNILVSVFISIFWAILGFNYFLINITFDSTQNPKPAIITIVSLIFVGVFILLLFKYAHPKRISLSEENRTDPEDNSPITDYEVR